MVSASRFHERAARKFPTKLRQPNFDEIVEQGERPTLVGKVLSQIVGRCGAGNGMALVPATLPRFGTVVCDDWLVKGYLLQVTPSSIQVCVLLSTVHAHLQDAMEPEVVRGPELAVTEDSHRWLASRKAPHDLAQGLYAMYGTRGYTAEAMREVREEIEKIASSGGSLLLCAEGVGCREQIEVPIGEYLPPMAERH